MELGRGCGPITTTNPSGRERAASRSWWRPNDRVRRDLVKPSRLGKKRDERDGERGRGRGRRRRFPERERLLVAIVGGHGSGERRRMDRERLARAATVPRTV